MNTGMWVVLVALTAAVAFGGIRMLTDGRVRAARPAPGGLSSATLGQPLGRTATFVQFSAPVCAPCRTTARLLGELTAGRDGVAHVELDVTDHLDVVERLGINRTPTVLLLDGAGTVRNRIVGTPRKAEVEQALARLDDTASEHTPKQKAAR